MDTSNKTYTGTVVCGPYYDSAEVEFMYNGKQRRILIHEPDGYGPQHALIGKKVNFKILKNPYGPSFMAEIGYASIIKVESPGILNR